jgi:hypothetical protein
VLSCCSLLTALSMGYKMAASGYDGLYDKDIAALVDVLPQLRALDVAHIAEQPLAICCFVPSCNQCTQVITLD